MFVDITSSTELSERDSLKSYYETWVNEFFHVLSGPVLDTLGEIYVYVGDQVVITWKLGLGVEDANCVWAIFQIDEAVRANARWVPEAVRGRPRFQRPLCQSPVEVIATEMWDLRKEIVLNGAGVERDRAYSSGM